MTDIEGGSFQGRQIEKVYQRVGKEAGMFDLANWRNLELLMLNLTNLGIGIFTLWLVVKVAWAFLQELVLRIRRVDSTPSRNR